MKFGCVVGSEVGCLTNMMRILKGFIEVSLWLRCVVWNEGGCLANMRRIVKGFNRMSLRILSVVGNIWRCWLFSHII